MLFTNIYSSLGYYLLDIYIQTELDCAIKLNNNIYHHIQYNLSGCFQQK